MFVSCAFNGFSQILRRELSTADIHSNFSSLSKYLQACTRFFLSSFLLFSLFPSQSPLFPSFFSFLSILSLSSFPLPFPPFPPSSLHFADLSRILPTGYVKGDGTPPLTTTWSRPLQHTILPLNPLPGVTCVTLLGVMTGMYRKLTHV